MQSQWLNFDRNYAKSDLRASNMLQKRERYAAQRLLNPIFRHSHNLQQLDSTNNSKQHFKVLQDSINERVKKVKLGKEFSIDSIGPKNRTGQYLPTESNEAISRAGFKLAYDTYQGENQNIELRLNQSKKKLRKL